MQRSIEVELPSKLVITVREFKVKDQDLLADKKAARRGTSTTNLLKAIALEMGDPGPYDFDSEIKWDKVIQGDRIVALKAARDLTWGSELHPQVTCANCETAETYTIDGDAFTVKPLPESSYDHVRTGEPLTCHIPDGPEVQFKLLRGEDDKLLQALRQQSAESLASSALRYRIVSVEGVSPPDLKEWVRELSGSAMTFLMDEFDDADGGLDTETAFSCATCGFGWVQDVRLDQSDFLFPKSRGRRTAKT